MPRHSWCTGRAGPLCGQQRAPPVARDREIGTGAASLPGAVEAQGPATDQAAQGGQHLDVEKMGHRELPLELPPETRGRIPSDKLSRHGGRVNDDHRRLSRTASTI